MKWVKSIVFHPSNSRRTITDIRCELNAGRSPANSQRRAEMTSLVGLGIGRQYQLASDKPGILQERRALLPCLSVSVRVAARFVTDFCILRLGGAEVPSYPAAGLTASGDDEWRGIARFR